MYHLQACFLLWVILSLTAQAANAQNIYDARQSVLLEASVQANPPKISLQWVQDNANGGYTIWRKAKSSSSWGDSLVWLEPNSTSWVDTNVSVGIGYEYQVKKSLPAFPYGNGTPNFGAGYIYAGIQLPAVHHRGACLLVIDSTYSASLEVEIARLLSDIEADGWLVQAIYVDRNTPVPTVRNYIKAWADSRPEEHKTLFLFGRVPVPYSGEIAPDGHHADHKGAWPCDGYYANLDGIWTDQTVNNTTAPGTRNDNTPGDGKFDNNVFPSLLQLQVGRVDFSNMTKFPESESELLRRYLNKDHAWRTGKTPAMERALVDNNFGDVEGLGQTGWMNFTPMFGFSKVHDVQYRQTLTNQSYMWAYGCGGGGPESASDISSTTNFTTDSLQMVFTMLFGSYFGDWDYPNDFLRAAIASRTCLASTWGNRPVWFLHHMALGEPIGYATIVTMNNLGNYSPRYYGNYVQNALMGDPSLRMHMLQPAENLSITQQGLHIHLSWEDPANALGYYIYKKTETDSVFQLLNQAPISDHTYIDPCPGAGPISYMVRSVELRTSASGTYYNLSTGVVGAIQSQPATWNLHPVVMMANAGQSNGSISLDPEGGCPPYDFAWSNGELSAEIQQLDPGTYCVTVSDCLACTEVYCATVELTNNAQSPAGIKFAHIYPNPVLDNLNLELAFESAQAIQIELLDLLGHRKWIKEGFIGPKIKLSWDVAPFPAGLYWLRVFGEKGSVMYPVVKL